jgi:hypothetical protein
VRHELKLNLLLSSCPTDEDAAGVDLHLLRVVVAAVSLHAYKVVVAAVVAVVVVAVDDVVLSCISCDRPVDGDDACVALVVAAAAVVLLGICRSAMGMEKGGDGDDALDCGWMGVNYQYLRHVGVVDGELRFAKSPEETKYWFPSWDSADLQKNKEKILMRFWWFKTK